MNLTIGIIMGFLLYWVIDNKLWNKIFKSAALIQQYWKFIIAFSFIFVLTLSIIIVKIQDESDLYSILNLVIQIATLVFAIFVGYFAFAQVVENRFEKLKTKGKDQLDRKKYKRAIQNWEQAHLIKRKDSDTLADLLEVYLIVKNFRKFDERIKELGKLIIEESDTVTFHYLRAIRYLLVENLGEAKERIKNLINFTKENPRSLEIFSWEFDDIKNSDTYTKLHGESKIIFDNLASYLDAKLNEEESQKFEGENYSFPRS